MFARMIANRQKLPGEELDEPKEESKSEKKTKRGDRSGDKEDFKKAEEGEVSEAGQTKGDDIDAQMETLYKSQGWK